MKSALNWIIKYAAVIMLFLFIAGGIYGVGFFAGNVATKDDLNNLVTKEDLTAATVPLQEQVSKLEEISQDLENQIMMLQTLPERLDKLEASLYDIQKMIIEGGLSRTSSISTLEEVLSGTPSISLQALEQQRTYWIRFESTDMAERILDSWIKLDPHERLLLFQELVKSNTFLGIAPSGSSDAYLFIFEEAPLQEKDLLWDAIISPDTEMYTLWSR